MRDGQHPLGRREAIITGCGVMASLLAACASTSGADETAVNLKYAKDGRFTGTFAGRSVNITSRLPSGSGAARGTVAGDACNANWQITSNTRQTVRSIRFRGTLAGQTVSLSAVFRLKPNYLFGSGTVTGAAAGHPVHAQATSAPGASSSSINVNGSFAGTPFSLYATLAGDLTSGLIRGPVDGKPTHLGARAQSGAVHITGDYSGPSELFVLATGSLLYFLGGIYAA